MQLKVYWKAFHRKINGLTLRERKLILLTSTTLVCSLVVMLVWMPLWKNWHATLVASEQFQLQIETSQNSIAALELRAKNDVNGPYLSRLENLKLQVSQQEKSIDRITSALIQPEKMNQVFKGLLSKSKMKLESLKNAPATKVEVNQEDVDNQVLYKHGLALQMQGQYFNSLSYLQTLEAQDWQLYWDELEFSTLSYPNGRLNLRVHTLSTSNKVLGL